MWQETLSFSGVQYLWPPNPYGLCSRDALLHNLQFMEERPRLMLQVSAQNSPHGSRKQATTTLLCIHKCENVDLCQFLIGLCINKLLSITSDPSVPLPDHVGDGAAPCRGQGVQSGWSRWHRHSTKWRCWCWKGKDQCDSSHSLRNCQSNKGYHSRPSDTGENEWL